MSDEELYEWLKRANDGYRSEDVPPKQRPFRAMSDLSRERGLTVILPSPLADKVFEWFKQNTQAGSHAIGCLFTGIYYFDACMWPVFVPIGFGCFHLDSLAALETMPARLKEQLCADKAELWNSALYWADCVDFAYGSDDLCKIQRISGASRAFLDNGRREIDAAIAQLSSARPNTKAAMSARLATEIYFKALLITRGGEDANSVKRFNHRLHDLFDKCSAFVSQADFASMRPLLDIFPAISDRYVGAEWPPRKVWATYCIAQAAAASVIRTLSGRDIRSQVLGSAA